MSFLERRESLEEKKSPCGCPLPPGIGETGKRSRGFWPGRPLQSRTRLRLFRITILLCATSSWLEKNLSSSCNTHCLVRWWSRCWMEKTFLLPRRKWGKEWHHRHRLHSRIRSLACKSHWFLSQPPLRKDHPALNNSLERFWFDDCLPI